jgi:hypothetical protein
MGGMGVDMFYLSKASIRPPNDLFWGGRIVGENLSWKEDTGKNTIKTTEMLPPLDI